MPNTREKLIELQKEVLTKLPFPWCTVWKDIATQIADHLIANGVILPPCKPGDTVYTVDKIRGVYELIEWRAVEISIDSHSRIVVLEHPHNRIKTRRGCDFEAFGVSAFLHLGTATRALRNRKTGITHVEEAEK